MPRRTIGHTIVEPSGYLQWGTRRARTPNPFQLSAEHYKKRATRLIICGLNQTLRGISPWQLSPRQVVMP